MNNRLNRIAALSVAALLATAISACDKSPSYNEQIETIIDNYINALEECDYDSYCSYQPDFYTAAYEDYAVTCGFADGKEYFVENEHGYYTSTLGSNINIQVAINSVAEMPEDELATGEKAIMETFDLETIDITKGFLVEVTETATGNKGAEDASQYEIVILEIEDKLYVYNQFFEYLTKQGY